MPIGWNATARRSFPETFVRAMAEGGWLGVDHARGIRRARGLGVTEAALMMLEVARAGGMSAASAIHMNIFGPKAIVQFGTEAQRAAWLPDLIAGRTKELFRGYRAGHRSRHDPADDTSGASGRPVHGERPQDVDIHGAGG